MDYDPWSKHCFINSDEFNAAAGFEEDVDFQRWYATTAYDLLGRFRKGGGKRPRSSARVHESEGEKETEFNLVWNSRGSKRRDKTSIWEPVASGRLKRNKVSISLGHFAGKSCDNRTKTGTKDCFLKLRTLPEAEWAEAVGILMFSTSTCHIQPDSDKPGA